MEAARQAFEKLYGHLLLSGKDAAWNVFLSGWEARGEQPKQACDHDWKYIGSKRQAMWECTKCGMYKVPDEQGVGL